MKEVFLIIEMDWVETTISAQSRQQQKSRYLRLPAYCSEKNIFLADGRKNF